MKKKTWYKKTVDYLRRAYFYRTRAANLTIDGVRVSVPEGISWDVLKQLVRGTYEQAERDLIRAHLDVHRPVIELGGSIGIVSAVIRSHLTPETPLVVVEANPKIIGTCRKNANGADGTGPTRVVNAAIAYGTNEVEFAVSDDYLSNRIADGEETDKARVPATTLTALADGLETFSLVMDIEGAEFELLENDAGVLKRCPLIIAEIHPNYFPGIAGRGETDFMKSAKRLGYRLCDRRDDVLVLARH